MRKYNHELRNRIEEVRSKNPDWSLANIANEVGVSRQRIHQILLCPTSQPSKSIIEAIARAVKRTRKKLERKAA